MLREEIPQIPTPARQVVGELREMLNLMRMGILVLLPKLCKKQRTPFRQVEHPENRESRPLEIPFAGEVGTGRNGTAYRIATSIESFEIDIAELNQARGW